MILKIKKITQSVILYYPVIYILLAFISNDIARKTAILLIFFLAIHIMRNKKRKQIIAVLLVFILMMLNAVLYGLNYIVHQDFYSYILLLIICIVYSDKREINKLDELIDKRTLIIIPALFELIILFSILFGNGLQYSSEWGTSMPLLYGPYELPHSLAYQLMIIFMLASIGWHRYKNNYFVMQMCICSIFIAWTGVRSVFLAFVIVLFYEYCNLKKVAYKVVIPFGGIILLLYLILFTDFLYANPIIQKTIQAMSQSSGITNGRTDFNSYLMKIFITELNPLQQIIGISIDSLRYYMSLRYTTALHAHNDFLNTLIGMGVVGLYLYIKGVIHLCKNNRKWFYVFIPIFILSFTNGLFMYIAFTPSLPIFLIYYRSLEQFKEKRENNVSID